MGKKLVAAVQFGGGGPKGCGGEQSPVGAETEGGGAFFVQWTSFGRQKVERLYLKLVETAVG